MFDLVGAGAPQSTITLRMEWNGPGARLTFDVNPATLAVRRYRALGLRIGQSTEPLNPAGCDQDVTLEISTGSRTVVVRAGTLRARLRFSTNGTDFVETDLTLTEPESVERSSLPPAGRDSQPAGEQRGVVTPSQAPRGASQKT